MPHRGSIPKCGKRGIIPRLNDHEFFTLNEMVERSSWRKDDRTRDVLYGIVRIESDAIEPPRNRIDKVGQIVCWSYMNPP